MQNGLKLLLWCTLVASTGHAAESFTRSLSPQDFSAAGLNKLSPAELTKLEELVAAREKVAVAAVPPPPPSSAAPMTSATSVAASPEAQATAKTRTTRPGFLERAKVLLTPGTEIEYSTLESKLVPPFNGWEKGTVLTLENGQRWQVTESGSYWGSLKKEPVPVKIEPGALGSFFMAIEGAGRPRVKLVAKLPTATTAH